MELFYKNMHCRVYQAPPLHVKPSTNTITNNATHYALLIVIQRVRIPRSHLRLRAVPSSPARGRPESPEAVHDERLLERLFAKVLVAVRGGEVAHLVMRREENGEKRREENITVLELLSC